MRKNSTLTTIKHKWSFLLFLTILFNLPAFGQQSDNVHGEVTSADNHADLVGVTVMVKGTAKGTTTDANGNFTINANTGDTLVFSYIGYVNKHLAVGSNDIVNVALTSSSQGLNEVVVTALGIERNSKSLSYATQKISTNELTKAKTPDFVNSLAGKSAGVVITRGTSGPGSSSRILIRGQKSFTGNSAPLYVIDGVPIGQAAGGTGGGFFGPTDEGDALSNLNPEDIASIQVLKGASASALYGSSAANGVILITTKKGKMGAPKVEVTSSTTFETPIELPQTQTTYGQTVSSANDSWGEKTTDGSNAFIKDFFNVGKTYINGVTFSSGSDIAQFYASYANTSATGIVPNNYLSKNNINVRGTGDFFDDKLHLDASVNYISQDLNNPPRSGFYQSPIFSLYLFPTGDDFSKYSGSNYEVYDSTRGLYTQNWPYIRNEASTNQNPYWISYKNLQAFFTRRVLMSFKARYDIADWLNVQARTTFDISNNRNNSKNYAGTDPVTAGSAGSLSGMYTTAVSNSSSLYSDLLINASGDLSKDISLEGTIGFSNTQGHSYDLNMGSNANSGLIYPNVFTVTNFVSPAASPGAAQFNYGEDEYKSLSQALFATATLGYKNTVYLDATARNEWSYTSPKPFFYPSVGLSYVLSQTLGTSDVFSFAKLRASYAQVGSPLGRGVNDRNPPYSVNTTTGAVNGGRTLPYFNGTDTATLVPERTTSYEIGANLRFFENKLSLDITYYDASTADQIFTIAAPVGSGASNFYINGGTIRNNGIEGIISYNADFGQLKWNTSLNFSHNQNQIRKISDLLPTDRFVVATSDGTRLVASFLTRPKEKGPDKYGSFGDLYGRTIEKNADGSIKVDDQGLPVLSDVDADYVGNTNPKLLAGFNNSFSYKGIGLSFLIDSRFGGDVFSLTQTWLDYKGLSQRTAEARDNGGVMVDGKLVPAEDYYLRISGGGNYPAVPQYRYSGTNIRLRELSLGYTFSNVGKVIKDINLSVIGRNLFFFYKDAPFDPETSIAPGSIYQGIDAFGLPSTRTYGFSLRASL